MRCVLDADGQSRYTCGRCSTRRGVAVDRRLRRRRSSQGQLVRPSNVQAAMDGVVQIA